MKLSELSDSTADALRSAGAFMHDLVAPTVRLGVTGFARAGKTVFITALVRNLVAGGRLPFFCAHAQGRIRRAYLEPQPDDNVPRFAYEDHLACLAAEQPVWPESTRRISQLRVTVEFETTARMRRAIGQVTAGALGPRLINIDIADYPGEWLADLAMMDLDFAAWSARVLADAQTPPRREQARAFLAFLADTNADLAHDEGTALKGAQLFTRYLELVRAAEPGLSALTPGRFLMPGELDGSPLLTFFPVADGAGDAVTASGGARASLRGQLQRRYESYKAHVVKPFFRDHFARLDRQIVLMDVLAALNRGPTALAELSGAMSDVLSAFRPGASTWGSRIFRRKVDRIVFAATKADHLHHQSHDRMEALLTALSERAIARAKFAGAEVKAMALASLRATREAEATADGQRLACIVGTPLAGERVAGVVFDGCTETALFPGDLPADPAELLEGAGSTAAGLGGHDGLGMREVRVLRFRPPRIVLQTTAGTLPPLPHIRLDRALEFLIGDKLA